MVRKWVSGYIPGRLLLNPSISGAGFDGNFTVNNTGAVIFAEIIEHGSGYPPVSEFSAIPYYMGTSYHQVFLHINFFP